MDEREIMYRLTSVIEDLKEIIRGTNDIDIQDSTIQLQYILEGYEAKYGELDEE